MKSKENKRMMRPETDAEQVHAVKADLDKKLARGEIDETEYNRWLEATHDEHKNNEERPRMLEKKSSKDHKVIAIVSLILAIIAALPYMIDLVTGIHKCSGEGCWGVSGIWLMCFGWVANIIAFILGIIGLKSSKKALAAWGIVLSFSPFIFMIIFMLLATFAK